MKRNYFILYVCSVGILFMVLVSYFKDTVSMYEDTPRRNLNNFNIKDFSANSQWPGDNSQVQFALAVCQSNVVKGKGFHENDRQFRQIKVHLKSAAVLTSTTIRYNIITDSEDVYKQIINATSAWPAKYRKRLVFAPRRNLYNPPELGNLRNVFRPCATERLFIPTSFKDVDAVIYTDSDTYFMQPPENLWAMFGNFDAKQIAGVAPHLFHYTPPFNKFPFFGFTGINSGVLAMNLTRIRAYPYGWIKSIKYIIEKYKGQLQFFDQDILNLLFSGKNASYAYELPCEWDYMFIFCNNIRNTCPSFATNGLALLHGVDTSFINDKGPKFKAVFLEWEKFDLKSPLPELIANMEKGLKKASSQACGRISNIDELTMKGIKYYLL